MPISEKKPPPWPAKDLHIKGEDFGRFGPLTIELSRWVTSTSSTANGIIDSASIELSKRIAEQLKSFPSAEPGASNKK